MVNCSQDNSIQSLTSQDGLFQSDSFHLSIFQKYDPQCGVSREVFEWQCRQRERVSSRTPELMRKIRGLTQRMRKHFQDDVEGLKMWDDYEENVLYAYERNLQTSLSRPVMTPVSLPHTLPIVIKILLRVENHLQ